MKKRIWLCICYLVFLAVKTGSGFAQELALPRLTFPSLVIATAEEPGPFYTGSPKTLSQHDLHLGCRYIFSDFKTFWGMDIDAFEQWKDPASGKNHVDLINHLLQLTVAYGITDQLLVGAMVPWKQVSFERTWEGNEIFEPGGFKDGNEGIGDMVTIARYQIFDELDEKPFSWAVGLDIKLATGDDQRIRVAGRGIGTGEIDYKASTMLSKKFSRGAAYFSLGYNWEGRFDWLDTLEYNLAVVFPITKKFSIAGEFLGVSFVNWEVDNDYGGIVDKDSMNTYDVGLGIKSQVKGINFELGLTYPLNDDYTRTRLQPAFGINYVF